MTESAQGPKYTERQLAILNLQVEPANQDEWNYLQDHANDILPKPAEPTKLFSVTGADLDRNFKRGGASTHAGHSGDALNTKES